MKEPKPKESDSCNTQILDQLHGALVGTRAMYLEVANNLDGLPDLKKAVLVVVVALERAIAILEGKGKRSPLILPDS